jgi:hypothetical protein
MPVKFYAAPSPTSSSTATRIRTGELEVAQGADEREGAFVEQHHGVVNTLDFIIRHYAEKNGTAACPKDLSVWKLEFDTGHIMERIRWFSGWSCHFWLKPGNTSMYRCCCWDHTAYDVQGKLGRAITALLSSVHSLDTADYASLPTQLSRIRVSA